MNDKSQDMFSESMETSRRSFETPTRPIGENRKSSVDISRSINCYQNLRSFSQLCSSEVNSYKKTPMGPPVYCEDPLLKLYGIKSVIKLEQRPPSHNQRQQTSISSQGMPSRSATSAKVKDHEPYSYSQPIERSHTSNRQDNSMITRSECRRQSKERHQYNTPHANDKKIEDTFESNSMTTRSESKTQSNKRHQYNTPTASNLKIEDTFENDQASKRDIFSPYICTLSSLVLLSGFLGAVCFAIIQHYFFNNGVCMASYEPTESTDIAHARLEQRELVAENFKNFMQSVGEELKLIRAEISKTKAHALHANPPRDVLQDLFPGEPDLACAGNRGSVLATPDTTTLSASSQLSFMGVFSFDLDWPHRQPHTVIQGLIQELGDCWAFSGERGRLVLSLHRPSLLTGVSLTHIPPTMSPSGTIASAPKHFLVLGHKSKDDFERGLVLGNFEYNSKGPWRQMYQIDPEVVNKELFQIVEFQFLENQGNPDHTCVYRVHVHGSMNY